MNKSLSTLKIALLSFVTLCLFCTTPVNAQNIVTDQLSAEYLAGFAFFKFAKVQPDFKDWVFRSPAYAAATPRDRTIMLRSDTIKLENSFAVYEIRKNPITLKTRVEFLPPTASLARRMIKEQGKVVIRLELPDAQDKFFPLQVAGMWIALIPADIEEFLTLQLTEDEWVLFKRQTEEQGLTGRAVGTLNLSLLPKTADTKRPLSVQGTDMWMLMADVVGLEIWSNTTKKMAWYIDIPGYTQNNQSQEIDNLYDR